LAYCSLSPQRRTQQAAQPKPNLIQRQHARHGGQATESAKTGRDYDIYIRPPDDYAKGGDKKYPVLYVLDGQWDFKLLDSIYGGLYYDGFVPEMIIVGITYSGDHPDYGSLRAMDYTPVSDSSLPGSGDAAKFLAFLKEELFPLIETHYRVDTSRRVLMGHSFGGLFTLYAMFAEPELFSDYVSGSPAVPYGGQFAVDQETEYASNHKDLPVRLFLFVGSQEGLDYPVEKFMQVLRERNYPGLEMETLIIDNATLASNRKVTTAGRDISFRISKPATLQTPDLIRRYF
jgi:predicted alpha/beta superfamily hydrolase